MDDAIDAVDELAAFYRGGKHRLVYAEHAIRDLAWRYERAGAWKSALPTFTESLLAARPDFGAENDEVSMLLFRYGHLLRFLHLDKEAVPVLETLMAQEIEERTLVTLSAEGTWGMLAACYESLGDEAAASRVRERVSEQTRRYRDLWAGRDEELRAAVRHEGEVRAQAIQSGALRTVRNDRNGTASAVAEDSPATSVHSEKPWWKFW